MSELGRTRKALVAGTLVLALAGGGVAACSGGRTSSTSGAAASSVGQAGAAPAPALGPEAAPARAADGSSGSSSGTGSGSSGTTTVQVDLATAARSRILTAAVDLNVPDVVRAVLLVTAQTTAAGGFIGSEDTVAASKTQGALATMTLRVPDARFDGVLTAVSAPAMGTVRSSTRSEQDVTGQVADLDSRLASDRASIARVRLLFAKATSVGAVIALESALTDRESTLESLEAQSRALDGQVADGTITLTLRGPAPAKAAVVHHSRAAVGFGTGLHAGWRAVRSLGRGIAVVTGALLPFLPVLAVLALLGWWLHRRQRRPAAPPTTPAPTPTPGV